MASSNEFKITIRGKGGHAAMPHNWHWTRCPWPAQMVQGFQTIISRNKKPIDAGVISVTMIHAGEATNVIPDSCELQGTVRTFSIEPCWTMIEAAHAARSPSTQRPRVRYGLQTLNSVRNYPPTINSVKEAEFARKRHGQHSSVPGAMSWRAGAHHGRRRLSPTC